MQNKYKHNFHKLLTTVNISWSLLVMFRVTISFECADKVQILYFGLLYFRLHKLFHNDIIMVDGYDH